MFFSFIACLENILPGFAVDNNLCVAAHLMSAVSCHHFHVDRSW